MTDRIHSQLDDFHRRIVRHRYSISSFCSNESTSSTNSTISDSSADHPSLFNSTSSVAGNVIATPDSATGAATASEHDHDSANCLSCTRRNVISVFPRFRKVSNRLLSPFFRGSQQRPSATCPVELHSNNGDSSATDNAAHTETKHFAPVASDAAQTGRVAPLPLHSSIPSPLHVYPTHPARAALCLGVWGADFKDIANSAKQAPPPPPSSSSADRQPASSAAAGRSNGITPLPIIPERLARGCPLLKTTSRGAHIRDFRLDIAQQRITWNSPKKKKLAHIDLERIVEIRVGHPALWAVADEDCLPNGTKRLFAIVFYNHMELKTICMVAQSDDDFCEWMDALTCLLSSRQPITTMAQFQRWRMVMLCRQWWVSDQSNQSATDALQCIEAAVCDKESQHAVPTATTATSYPLPISRVPHVRSEQFLDELAVLRALTPPKSSGMRKWLSGSSGGPSKSPSLASIMTYSASTASPSQRHSQHIQQQLHDILKAQQLLGCDDWVLGTAESIYAEHPQRSSNTLYEEIALSFVNNTACQTPSSALAAEHNRFDSLGNSDSSSDNGNDNGNDNDDDSASASDSDSDELTMNGSAKRIRKLRMPLHLEIPKEQSFGLTLPVFARFLREVQKEDVGDADTERRFRSFVPPGAEVMAAYELEAYLLSEFNLLDYSSPASAKGSGNDKGSTETDMDLPLNQYYVSTSHNTYLTGDQLVGTATVEGYVHAMLRGCRCLELDCWDGRCGEPVVCHGHTFTTRILFEDVIIAISRYAFAASPYPVILSFETHCSLPQQARMAEILKKYLGGMMVLAPVGGDQETELPSPNQLKYRIIIKNKVLEPPKRRWSTVTGGHSRSKSVRPESTQPNQQERCVSPRTSTAQLKRKVAPELSELIVYCKAVHFEGFESEKGPEPAFDQITSVSESASNQLMRQHPKQYANYNAMQMTRVYPSFSRFTSTNFNPINHWATGCQLVALNFQTLDRNMQLYESMFHSSLGTGYVPKPNHLREPKPNHSTCGGDNDTDTMLSPPQSQGAMNSPTLKQTMSWSASLASPMETTEPTSALPPSLAPRRTTVHVSVISAYNVAMEAAGFASAGGNSGSGSGSSRRASNVGLMMGGNGAGAGAAACGSGGGRRGSFSADPSSFVSGSHSPHRLSPSPSDVAMFANAAPSATPFTADYSLLNAAAAVAAADAVANLAALQQHQNQGHHQSQNQNQKPPSGGSSSGSQSTAASRIRIVIEWICEGSASGQQKTSNRQSVEDPATLASALGGSSQQQQQPGGIAMGLSAIHSLHGTAPSSPLMQPQQAPQHQGGSALTGYPFLAMSTSGSSLVTPLHAPPPAPTPLAHSSTAAFNKGQSSKNRYVTRNGTVSGSEIWWKDESLFRVVNDPEISFMRVALMDDDVEVGSACMSVDSLKEGYRYVELCENEKSTSFCRPIQVLIHVQMSQLHCLVSPN
ncbi:1-phosphatidylinositol 4,5-bisphosphate phosphodiesterase delta-1 [Coemansia sp. RSA 1843]|nr:1-phosphatidylinositol 4,5-bisphosphate phosphodiesterase delta-1 [Coemansia sp. RSA 1843]